MHNRSGEINFNQIQIDDCQRLKEYKEKPLLKPYKIFYFDTECSCSEGKHIPICCGYFFEKKFFFRSTKFFIFKPDCQGLII